VKPVQTITSAKTANILYRVERLGAVFANSDKLLHRPHLPLLPAKVTLPNGFPHELRDGSFSIARAGVKSIPEIIVKV
jgi:hypothetical protein